MSLIGDALSGILKPIADVIDHVTVSGDDKIKIQAALLDAQQAALAATTSAQSDVDKIEAANSSVFVAGWRPAIGWVCAVALAYQYVLSPVAAGIARISGHPIDALPSLDGQLWELMFGMLGMGTLRTVEKLKK
jgi:hypothetical protein